MDSEERHMSDHDPLKPSLTSTEIPSDNRNYDMKKDMQLDGDGARDEVMQMVSCKTPNVRLSRKGSPKEGPLAMMCKWIIAHQIGKTALNPYYLLSIANSEAPGLTLNLVLLHALTHICFPRARPTTRKFHLLSYHNPRTGNYALGQDDLYLVSYSIIVLTGLRATTMEYVLVPLAQMGGAKTKKERVRLSEQGWVLIYDMTMFSLGMYIMYTHEHWLNMKEMWTGWPNREVEGPMKWYYLVQFAFWLQQILVVNIEERRKDHWQMLTHHLITCALMISSYCYHQTKVGNVILSIMEIVDLLLAAAKILKYLQFQIACDIAFGVFMIGWVIARHVIFLRVTYSVYSDSIEQTTCGCYSGSNENITGPFEVDGWSHLWEPFINPTGVICWNDTVSNMFVYALLALQVILCVWFCMIVKVAAKVIRGGEAIDSRSDDEEEVDARNEAEEKFNKKNRYQQIRELPPLEEDVGVESINLSNQRRSPSRKIRKSGSVASGVTLHSDRKELLGRIGCDKMSED